MNDLEFFEDSHTYWLNNKELTGTTSLIKKFVPSFNAQFWATRKAHERNAKTFDTSMGYFGTYDIVTPADILREWDEIRDRASLRGKFIHAYLEDVLQDIPRHDEDDCLIGVKRYLDEAYYGYVIGCEMLLNDDWFAGTADLLVVDKGRYIIRDWKTNRQFRKRCPYGNRMLGPLKELHATEYFVYTLQLNMYRYLVKPFYNVTKLEIVWFDHENNYQVIELPIVEDYLMLMLNAHKSKLK